MSIDLVVTFPEDATVAYIAKVIERLRGYRLMYAMNHGGVGKTIAKAVSEAAGVEVCRAKVHFPDWENQDAKPRQRIDLSAITSHYARLRCAVECIAKQVKPRDTVAAAGETHVRIRPGDVVTVHSTRATLLMNGLELTMPRERIEESFDIDPAWHVEESNRRLWNENPAFAKRMGVPPGIESGVAMREAGTTSAGIAATAQTLVDQDTATPERLRRELECKILCRLDKLAESGGDQATGLILALTDALKAVRG